MACRGNDLACVFEKQSQMGRPQQRVKSSTATTKTTTTTMTTLNASIDEVKTLKGVLTNIDQEIFSTQSLMPTNAFNVALRGYMKEQAPYLQYGEEEMKEQQPCPAIVYDALLPMLVKDIIETCKHKFSRLGQSKPYRQASYLAISLARDETTQFSTGNLLGGVEATLEDVEFRQLAQTWSKVHPLSSCVSMSQVSGVGPLNKALRAIIGGEGLVMVGRSGERSDRLLKQAQQYFCETRLLKSGYKQTMLYACQVSTLLAWNCLSHVKARIGVTFLALSCQLITQLQSETSKLSGEDQLCLENLTAILSLITVWTFCQLDRPSANMAGGVINSQSHHTRFFYSVSQMTSLLLDSHPDLYERNGNSTYHDGDFLVICDHLRQAITSVSTEGMVVEIDSKGEQWTAAVREVLILSLYVPRTVQDPLMLSARVEEMLSRCNNAVPLLASLSSPSENINRKGRNLPLLTKLNYHRTKEEDDDVAWKSTLASLLFETLSESIQAMSTIALQYQRSTLALGLVDLCEKILNIPMPLVVETPLLTLARESISRNLVELQTVKVEEGGDWKWLNDVLPMVNSDTTMPFQLDLGNEGEDVFDSLWGQLQWDFNSESSSLFTPSPNSLDTQGT